MQELEKKYKSAYNRLRRWINANELYAEISKSNSSMELFYYDLYKPYIQSRYGKAAIILPFEDVFSKEREFKIVLVKHKNTVVSAGVLNFVNQKATLGFLGVNPDSLDNIKRWFSGVVYYFSVQELQKMAYKKFHVGGSSSFLNNGLLHFKTKFGAKLNLKIPYQPDNHVLFKIEALNELIWNFLTKNPFAFINEDGKLIVAIWMPYNDYSLVDFKQNFRHIIKTGITEWQIFYINRKNIKADIINYLTEKEIQVKTQKLVFPNNYLYKNNIN